MFFFRRCRLYTVVQLDKPNAGPLSARSHSFRSSGPSAHHAPLGFFSAAQKPGARRRADDRSLCAPDKPNRKQPVLFSQATARVMHVCMCLMFVQRTKCKTITCQLNDDSGLDQQTFPSMVQKPKHISRQADNSQTNKDV